MQELSFDERVGSTAAALLQAAAESSDAVRLVIGRMIKYNIPRFLRLTDVTDDANYGIFLIVCVCVATLGGG